MKRPVYKLIFHKLALMLGWATTMLGGLTWLVFFLYGFFYSEGVIVIDVRETGIYHIAAMVILLPFAIYFAFRSLCRIIVIGNQRGEYG